MHVCYLWVLMTRIEWDNEERKTAGDLTIPVTYLCSSDSHVSHDDGDDLPAAATEDLSAAQEDDAFHDSDDDEGGDSKDIVSAAAGPNGEYSQKRTEHMCHAGMVGQGREGRDAKYRILMRGCIDVLNSNEMQWASCCGVSFGGCNARL